MASSTALYRIGLKTVEEVSLATEHVGRKMDKLQTPSPKDTEGMNCREATDLVITLSLDCFENAGAVLSSLVILKSMLSTGRVSRDTCIAIVLFSSRLFQSSFKSRFTLDDAVVSDADVYNAMIDVLKHYWASDILIVELVTRLYSPEHAYNEKYELSIVERMKTVNLESTSIDEIVDLFGVACTFQPLIEDAIHTPTPYQDLRIDSLEDVLVPLPSTDLDSVSL